MGFLKRAKSMVAKPYYYHAGPGKLRDYLWTEQLIISIHLCIILNG